MMERSGITVATSVDPGSLTATGGRSGPSVLHVIAPGAFGGAEHVVLALAGGQRARGVSVRVAAILDREVDPHEQSLISTLRTSGVPVDPIPLPPRSYAAERRAVADLVRRHRSAVVHTHGYRADVVDGPHARMLGAAAVTTVHGFTGGRWKNRFYEILQRRAYRRFDGVVAVSDPLARLLEAKGIYADRIHVIRNGWRPAADPLSRASARARLGAHEATFLVGWVGRVSHEKGLDLALEALSLRADPPIRLAVIGTGTRLEPLRRRAAALGLTDRIDWHGPVPEAGRLFSAFDAFVLSSRTEGTPMVLFEAMAARVPIVATTVGGVPHVLSEREALLVSPEDPVALADAIGNVYARGSEARARAERAAARLESEFGWERWVERYNELYRSIVAQRTRVK